MSGPTIANPANAAPAWLARAPVSAVKSGQQLTTTSAADLPSVTFNGQVTIKAPKANAAAVEIGAAGETLSTGHVLDPGDQITLYIPNLNLLYLLGANTSDKVTWLGY